MGATGTTYSLALTRTSSQYAYAANSSDFDLADGCSMLVWVKLTSLSTSTNYYLCSNHESGSLGTDFYISVDGSDNVKLNVSFTGAGSNYTLSTASNIVLPTGEWVALGFKLWDDGSYEDCRFYVNGQIRSHVENYFADPKNGSATTGAFYIGAKTGGSDYLDGKIGEVQVWSKSLSNWEFYYYAYHNPDSSDSDLVAHWLLDNDGTDETGTHTLTLSGSPSYSADVHDDPDTAIDVDSGLIEYVSCYYTRVTSAIKFSGSDPFTLAIWYDPQETAENFIKLFDGSNGYIFDYSSTYFQLTYYTSTGAVVLSAAHGGFSGWTHCGVATWVDSGTRYAEFYKNGVSLGTDSDTDDVMTSIGNASLFVGPDGGGYVDAHFCEAAIYAARKTDGWFSSWYNHPLSGGDSDMAAGYPMSGYIEWAGDITANDMWLQGSTNSPSALQSYPSLQEYWSASPAAATSAAVSPSVTLGAVTVTPSPAVATSAAVSPSVTLGELTVTPDPAAATAQIGRSNPQCGVFVKSSSQYCRLAVGSTTGLNTTGDCTWTWQCKAAQALPASGYYGVMGIWDVAATARNRIAGFFNTGGKDYLYSVIENNTASDYCQQSFCLTDAGIDITDAHSYAISVDMSENQATMFRFYVDGAYMGHGVISRLSEMSASYTAAGTYFRLGNFYSTGTTFCFDGRLDECCFFDDVRTHEEIWQYRARRTPITEPNLQGCWRQDGDWTDATTNGNDLDPQNSPTFSTDVPFEDGAVVVLGELTVSPAPAVATSRAIGAHGADKWFANGNSDVQAFFSVDATEIYLGGKPASGNLVGEVSGTVLTQQTTPNYQQALTGEEGDPLGVGIDLATADGFVAGSSSVHDASTGAIAYLGVIKASDLGNNYCLGGKRDGGAVRGMFVRSLTGQKLDAWFSGASGNRNRTLATGAPTDGTVGWFFVWRATDDSYGIWASWSAENTGASGVGDMSNSQNFAIGYMDRNAVGAVIGPWLVFEGSDANTLITNRATDIPAWWSSYYQPGGLTVSMGGISVSPAPAATASAAVTPTAEVGEPPVHTPLPASTGASAVSPSVSLGAVTRSPSPAATAGAAVSPSATSDLYATASPAASGAAAVSPAISLGALTKTAAPAAASSGVRYAVLSLGGGVVYATPGPASVGANAVSPSLSFGAITASPSPAVTASAATAPVATFGGVSTTASPAVSAAAAVGPTAAFGGISVSASPAPISATAVSPAYTSDWITSPAPAASASVAVSPSASVGASFRTPAPAASGAAAISPALSFGGISVSASPAQSGAAAVSPTASVEATLVSPAPASAGLSAVSPAYISGWVASPGPAQSLSVAVSPTTVPGALAVSPSPASSEAQAVAPLVSSDAVVSPSPASTGAAVVSPTLALSLTVSPGPASSQAQAVTPAASVGAILAMPAPATMAASAVSPSALAGVYVTPAPAATATAAQDPGSIVGDYAEQEWDGKITPYPGINGGCTFEWDGKVS